MALGGGKYDRQNKILPGSYYKFETEKKDSVPFSDRGVVAVPMVLNWQPEEMIRMQNTDDSRALYLGLVDQWKKDALRVFGYPSQAPELVYIREIFRNAKEVYIYPLGKATKASNAFATAKNGGIRGNDLAIVIDESIDEPGSFDVITLLDAEVVDYQVVTKADELVGNDFVDWKTVELVKTASTPLTGGLNATVQGADYQAALEAFELIRFNTLICPVSDEVTKKTFVSWTNEQNDQHGNWHTLVLHQLATEDSEYVTSVSNNVAGDESHALVYYVGGEQAAVEVQKVTDNNLYTGELELLPAAANQTELAHAMVSGEYVYHLVEGEWRVLADQNTYISRTDTKGEEFSYNQVIRVLQQRAIDSTRIFRDEFLGVAGTDTFDHDLYKERLIKHAEYLARIKAIKNFDPADIIVTAGEQIDSYKVFEYIQPNLCVRKVYHDIVVR